MAGYSGKLYPRHVCSRQGRQERETMSDYDVRYHSADDMSGLGELGNVMEPVAVVIRPDGSVDTYGYMAVIDQRSADADREHTANLEDAARRVVDSWESGDLAGAVNWLASLLPEE